MHNNNILLFVRSLSLTGLIKALLLSKVRLSTIKFRLCEITADQNPKSVKRESAVHILSVVAANARWARVMLIYRA